MEKKSFLHLGWSKRYIFVLYFYFISIYYSQKNEKKKCAHFFLSVFNRLTFWNHSSAHENKFSQIFTHFYLPHRWAFFRCFTLQRKVFQMKKKSFRNTKIWIRLRAFHLQKVYLTPPTTMVWEMGEVNRVNIVGVRNISMCYVNGTWMNGNSDWILFGGCFDYVISRHFSARLRLEESEPIVWKNFFYAMFVVVFCWCRVWKRREKKKSENE